MTDGEKPKETLLYQVFVTDKGQTDVKFLFPGIIPAILFNKSMQSLRVRYRQDKTRKVKELRVKNRVQTGD